MKKKIILEKRRKKNGLTKETEEKLKDQLLDLVEDKTQEIANINR